MAGIDEQDLGCGAGELIRRPTRSCRAVRGGLAPGLAARIATTPGSAARSPARSVAVARFERNEPATAAATASARWASAGVRRVRREGAVARTITVAIAAVATIRKIPIRAFRAEAPGSAVPTVASFGCIV